MNAKILHELFAYRADGTLIWRVKPAQRVQIGDIAGSKRADGRAEVSIKNKPYKLHRLIFLWHHGWLPIEVDHKDNDPGNNRIENLRSAKHIDNMRNSGARRNNRSGVKGVSWDKTKGKWVAQCGVNSAAPFRAVFDRIEDAEAAVKQFRELHHGEFANHG